MQIQNNTVILKTDKHMSKARLELLLKRVAKAVEKQVP